MFLLALATLQPSAGPAAVDRVTRAELAALDTRALDRFLGSLEAEVRPYLPDFRESAAGGGRFDPGALARGLLKKLGREMALNAHLLGELVLLAVVCVLLTHLGQSFAAQNVSKLAFYVCYLVMMGLAVNSFLATVRLGRSAVGDLVGFMYALLPVVTSLLAAAGGVTASALLDPMVLGSVATIGHLVQNLVFPLAVLTAVVTLVGHLAEGFSLTRLSALLRDVTIGMTGTLLAGFVGLLVARGVTAAAADGVGLRAAKYVSGTFVPVVGKGISDAMETVAGCSLVLKNAMGGYGAWTLAVLTALPLAKILAVIAIYRVAAALVQPLGETRLADALHTFGNCFVVLFAVTALVGLAFFLGLTILVALGNLTYALR